MKKIYIMMFITMLVTSTIDTNAKSDSKDFNEESFQVIKYEQYDCLSEKDKNNYLNQYLLVLQKEMTRQIKQNQKNIMNEVSKKDDVEKATKLERVFKDYSIKIDINDKQIKEKLEQSLVKPVTFSDESGIYELNNTSSLIIQTSGDYLEQYKNDFIWYAGRVISISLFLETWTSQAYFDGSYYPTYDISEFIYSWSGNSSYDDRIQSIDCTVTQADGRISSLESRYYTTGWAEQYYSGSFSKTASAIDLPAACIVESFGVCAVGIESQASFDGGEYIEYKIIQSGYGSLNY